MPASSPHEALLQSITPELIETEASRNRLVRAVNAHEGCRANVAVAFAVDLQAGVVIVIAMAGAPCRREKTETVRAGRFDGDEAGLEEGGQLAAAFIWAIVGLAIAFEIGVRAPIYGHACLAPSQSTQGEQVEKHDLHAGLDLSCGGVGMYCKRDTYKNII